MRDRTGCFCRRVASLVTASMKAADTAGRSGEEPPAMRRGLLAGFGALLTVAGVIWTLQGLGYIGGSVMTGVPLWAVVGPIAAVIGLAMAVTALRRRAAG
jgi:hypothetical protein